MQSGSIPSYPQHVKSTKITLLSLISMLCYLVCCDKIVYLFTAGVAGLLISENVTVRLYYL